LAFERTFSISEPKGERGFFPNNPNTWLIEDKMVPAAEFLSDLPEDPLTGATSIC
jgi:hypothetical protein